tara:strand:- start:1208 stop:1444 length:237 start_codon:yes stop_codon:yes gene_type:complete
LVKKLKKEKKEKMKRIIKIIGTLLITAALAGCSIPKNPKLTFGKKCVDKGENIVYSYVWLYDKESGLEANETTCEKID